MEGGFALGKLHRIAGVLPTAPFQIDGQLTLEQYDEDNFRFVKLEFSAAKIIGTSFTPPFSPGDSPTPNIVDVFSIDIPSFRVQTVQ